MIKDKRFEMIWNPFAHLIKTKRYKSAHITGSSLRRRIKDTFQVFYGSFYGNKNGSIDNGVLDYIFPLPRLSEIPLYWIKFDGTETKTTIIAAFALGITAFLLNIPKLIIATLLTGLATPFVSLVHLFMKPKVRKLKQEIDHLKVIPVKKNRITIGWSQEKLPFGREKPLKVAFNNKQIKSLLIRPIFKLASLDQSHMVFDWDNHQNTEIYLGLFDAQLPTNSSDETPAHLEDPGGALLGVIKLSSKNVDAVNAMLKINKFLITETVSKTDTLAEIEEKIKMPKLARQAFFAGLLKSDRNISPVKILTNSCIFDKNVMNLLLFYSGHANAKQTKLAENMLKSKDISQPTPPF